MWPYTNDEVKWLALSRERTATVERAQRAIDDSRTVDGGAVKRPANDPSPFRASMVDPR